MAEVVDSQGEGDVVGAEGRGDLRFLGRSFSSCAECPRLAYIDDR